MLAFVHIPFPVPNIDNIFCPNSAQVFIVIPNNSYGVFTNEQCRAHHRSLQISFTEKVRQNKKDRKVKCPEFAECGKSQQNMCPSST